jgi:hypothetical protein
MRLSRLNVLMVAALAPSSTAWAQQDTEDLRQIISQQNELIQRLTGRIDDLEERLAELETQRGSAASATEPAVSSTARDVRSTREPPGTDADESLIAGLSEDDRREQERLVRAAFQRTLIERGGLLLAPGTIDVQPSIGHAHSSADNIVIDGFTILPVLVIGDIVSERVQRDVSQLATTFRFGLPWSSQLEVRLPYSYHRSRSFSADNAEVTTSGSSMGDIDIGFSRQLVRSQGVWPDLLASLRWKTTSGTSPFDIDPATMLATGAGYDSLNLALTGVKVVDPVVYFASLNYSRNYSRTELIGHFDPGDSVGFSLGMAIALNLNNSLSFSYDQQSTRRSYVERSVVPGSYLTTGVLSVGTSFAISDSLTADLSLGVGVTADSPDAQLGVSFPIRLRRSPANERVAP